MTNFSLSEEQLESIKTMLCSESEADRQQAGQLLTIAQVTELDLSGTEIGDAGLAHLSGLTDLRTLVLGGTFGGEAITDLGVAHLSGLTNLTSLSIYGSGDSDQLTDASFAHLSTLTRLTSLDLRTCNLITDAGLAHLSGFTNLTSLHLRTCNLITDAGLAHLLGLTNLTSLFIHGSGKLTDVGITHLSGLTNLKELGLSGFTDANLAHLSDLANLKELHLDFEEITDTGLANLSKLMNLKTLSLSGGYDITDSDIARIARLANLTSLELDGRKITEEGVAQLSGLTNLERFYFYEYCEGISDSVLEDPLAYLGQIREQIEKSKKLLCSESETDRQEAVEQLKAARVATFDLSGTAITDAGLFHLSGLTSLTSLNLSRCDGVTDAGLAHLSGLTSLTSLDVSGCKGITDAGLPDLSGLTNLESLDLSETLITDDGLVHLWPLSSSGAGGNLTWLSLHTCPRLCLVHATEDTSLASLDACNPSCPSERLSAIYASLTDGSYAQSRMCKLLASNVNLPSDILERLLESEYRWVREAAAANPILSQSQIDKSVSNIVAGDRYILKGYALNPNCSDFSKNKIESLLKDETAYPIETSTYVLFHAEGVNVEERVVGSVEYDQLAECIVKHDGDWSDYVWGGEGVDWYDFNDLQQYFGTANVVTHVEYPDGNIVPIEIRQIDEVGESPSIYEQDFLCCEHTNAGFSHDWYRYEGELEYELKPECIKAYIDIKDGHCSYSYESRNSDGLLDETLFDEDNSHSYQSDLEAKINVDIDKLKLVMKEADVDLTDEEEVLEWLEENEIEYLR